ncbi:methionyl-tRNA formyltransferase [Patescibacteria group bacterium]
MTNKSKIRILFMGTPKFAVPSFLNLHQNPDFEIVLVISESDKPANRDQKIQKPEIAKLAKKLGYEVFQPESLKNIKVIKEILRYKPNIIITVAYGKFLPRQLLKKTINLHPSLLPKYRGPSPIQSAILAGDKKTGVSILLSDEKMDHGPILTQKQITIKANDTYLSLSEKLAKNGAKLLSDTTKKYFAGEIKPKFQDHKKATICKLIKKQNGKLDFSKPAEILEREVHAYFPWPSTFFVTKINNQNKQIKILESSAIKQPNRKIKIGGLYSTNKKDLFINCKKGALQILKLQIEGKSPISASDFINGYLK